MTDDTSPKDLFRDAPSRDAPFPGLARRRQRRHRAVSPPCFFLLCSLVLLALSIAWVEGTRADSQVAGCVTATAAGHCPAPVPAAVPPALPGAGPGHVAPSGG